MNNEPQSEKEAFDALTKHVLQYINTYHHPHTMVIVTPTNVQVLEGVRSSGEVFDYVRD